MEFKDKIIFTVREVAEILSLRNDVVIDLIDKGYIRAMRLQGQHITKTALMEFIRKYDGVDIGNELYGNLKI